MRRCAAAPYRKVYLMKRSSGILLPVFSLPSSYGIGTFGKEAYNFIDFLVAAEQEYWQMLPVGPTGFGDSPYQSFSAYAGNPYFIDLEFMAEGGLLSREEIELVPQGEDPIQVNYGILYHQRRSLLRKGFSRFDPQYDVAFDYFCKANADWLNDYALYMSLKQHFDMKPWQDWEDAGIRLYRRESVEKYSEFLQKDILFHCFIQFLFFSQWNGLRSYAKQKGIKFIGDIPIYLSMDSADAWASSEILQYDKERRPLKVGGVPPDYFSETGQLWGNPLYDWDEMKKDGYSFWIRRLAASSEMFDAVRLDHFRGFESYWSVPFGEATAVKGEWMPGPGMDLIGRIKEKFPKLCIIAEDLGCLTPEVHELVRAAGFPGMNVLQFAFGSGNRCSYLPHRHNINSVVYTGTHDNTTVRGWFEDKAQEEERIYAKKYLGLSSEEGWNWGFIRGAMGSPADLCIVQMQDYLDLPDSARTNTPGTLGGNWMWRLAPGQLTDGLAGKIAEMTRLYDRERL